MSILKSFCDINFLLTFLFIIGAQTFVIMNYGTDKKEIVSEVLGYGKISWKHKSIAYGFGIVLIIFGLLFKCLPKSWFERVNDYLKIEDEKGTRFLQFIKGFNFKGEQGKID